MVVQVLKAIGIPGSFGFLYFGLAVGILLVVWKRTRRLGRAMLIALAGGYLVLSVPAVAHSIAGPGTEPAAPFSTYGSLDEVYVIDGDNYRGRAFTAAQLAATAKPHTVWFLGGIDLGYALLASGVPPQLWKQAPSPARTTQTQVIWIKRSIARTRARRPAIVTSRLQAPRVLALARHEQLDIVIVPAPLTDEPPRSGVRLWLPSRAGLALSREALYERLAMILYRRNGWIS
jgi:uncharacterized SAM-binding protein YcdF (DUF218 family)